MVVVRIFRVACELLSSPILGDILRVLITLWILVEVAFYLYLRHIVTPQLNKLSIPPPSSSRMATPWVQFHRIIDVVADMQSTYPFEKFFSGWFRGAKLQDIYRGNVRDMLGWALFSKDFELCTVREKACIENVLINLKMRFAVHAPEGYNPAVKAMLLTLEPIQYVHRPLLFYMSLTAVQVAGDAVLTLFGFSRHELNGIAYWYRSPKKVAPADRSMPMVFFHGISPGLNLYVLMVHVLARDRKAVLVEVPHIAMCLNFQAKRLGDMVKTVEIITRRHRMSHFAVAGHSFGSLCAAWVVKHLQGAVQQLILLDPVCLLLGLPDVSYNFLYKKPRTIMEYILYYGGSTEMTIHHTLRRQFWWYEGQLFLDELSCPVYVGLSGSDEIVPSSVIRDYIEMYRTKHHIDEHYYRGNARRADDKDKEPGVGAPCASKRCSLGMDARGCIYDRIQYTYWPHSSHGDSLFNIFKLRELDKAIREQERTFRMSELAHVGSGESCVDPLGLSASLAGDALDRVSST